nr:MAG TPA: hypothetical protein [Caudoviricetes sp.]
MMLDGYRLGVLNHPPLAIARVFFPFHPCIRNGAAFIWLPCFCV